MIKNKHTVDNKRKDRYVINKKSDISQQPN